MRLGEPRAAEDAVQETFLRAYRAMPRFEGEFHLRAWLHRILTNVCFDEGDRRRREIRAFDRAAGLAELDGAPADEVLDIDRAYAQREVATALASLPVAYREALELRYVEQLSFREVADVTGVSEENARARVHRGRAALRRLISGPYAFAALFIPALRKGERAAQAALSAGGDSANSVSAASTFAQSSPTFTRLAVELSGPMSTKAGIVAGVVAAATTVAVPVASTVAEHTFANPPAAVVAAPASKAAEPLASPQDTVIVVDQTPTAPVVDPATQVAPTDAAAAPTDAAAPADAATGDQETFSAPPAAAAVTPTDPAVNTSTPPVATDPLAVPPVAPAGPLGVLASSGVVGSPDGTQIAINGPATLGGVDGSIGGSLAITPGATIDDPVRLDGSLAFTAADGTVRSMRVAMRAAASTDANGVTTYAVSVARYELTDATGATSTGAFTGSIVTGPGAASSISLSFS
jgi:RNA polymerase sigma-70 factor (ECF subfamily)